MEKRLPSMAAVLVWLSASPAHAGEAPSDFTVSPGITLASDYVSRGLSLNWGRPAWQGGVEVAHRSGAYGAAYFSQLSDNYYAGGTVETDLYLGLRRPLNEVFSYDVGLGAYFYPGANYRKASPPGGYPSRRYDTVEMLVGLTYRGVNVKYARCLTDYYGYDDRTVPLSVWSSGVYGGVPSGRDTRGSDYLEANYGLDLGNGFEARLHAGYQRVAHGRGLSYADFRLGIGRVWGDGWSAALAGSATRGADIYEDFQSVAGTGGTRDIGGRHWLFTLGKVF